MEMRRLLDSSDSEDEYNVYNVYTNEMFPATNKSREIPFKEIARVIKSGNLEKLRNILNERKIFLSDSNGSTVLHVAAATDNNEVLSQLLKDKRCSALLNRQNREGITPLMTALLTSSYETMNLLCSRGADPTKTQSKTERNALHLATIRNDTKAAEILLDHNSTSEFLNAINKSGDTPLIEAVHVKSPVLNVLLKAKASISVQNPENGRTVLHVTVAYNRLNILNQILEHPDATFEFAEIKDIKGDTALLIAVKLDRVDIIKILTSRFDGLTGVNYSENQTVYHISIEHDRADILRILLQSSCNASVDYINKNHKTPILYACELDRLECLEELTQNDADYNIKNYYTGETFAHVVAKYNSTNVLPYIMKLPDVSWFLNQKDNRKNTPYMTAITNGNYKFLKEAFKERQLDLNQTNSDGEPPVYYTAKQGHTRTLQALLLSPRYYYFAKRKENVLDIDCPDEILKAEIRGDIYATDVFLLLRKSIRHPLVSYFPPSLLKKTKDNRNVFHACAVGGNLEGLEFLYEFFRLFEPKLLDTMFDAIDIKGDSPLLLSAQCGLASRTCVYFFATHGADLAAANSSGLNVVKAILEYIPEACEPLFCNMLDSCVKANRDHYNEDKMSIKLHYNILCPKGKKQMAVVYTLFNEVVKQENNTLGRKILQHPLVVVFLKDKFRNVRPYVWFRFMLCLISTIGISLLVPMLFIGGSSEEKYGSTMSSALSLVFFVMFCLSLLTCIFKISFVFLREIWLVDIIAFLPSISMLALLIFGKKFEFAPEISALTILTSWFFLLVFVTTLYSTYSFQIAVFLRILSSISKHLTLLTTIMFSFALSFYCVYHEDIRFSSFPTSFIYSFIVLLPGYLVDLPTFKKEYFTTTPVNFHFIIECFVLSAFIVIVVVAFVNMLVGLAVRSARTTEIDGSIYQQQHEAHFLTGIQFWFDNALYHWLLKNGIMSERLEKMAKSNLVKVDVDIYDDNYKDIIDDTLIHQFRSIVYQRHKRGEDKYEYEQTMKRDS